MTISVVPTERYAVLIQVSEDMTGFRQSVSLSDDDLVARLQDDKLAFVSIFEKYHRWIHALCFKMLRSQDKADDATQEVFARAFVKLDKLEHVDKLGGWLKAIAVNYCRSVIQQERLYCPFNFDLRPSSERNAEQALISSEQRELVGKIIDRLRPRQRLVFVMKYIDGYTCRQIQLLTGFSDKQIKSYLQNARRNFKNSWHAERMNDGRKANKRPPSAA